MTWETWEVLSVPPLPHRHRCLARGRPLRADCDKCLAGIASKTPPAAALRGQTKAQPRAQAPFVQRPPVDRLGGFCPAFSPDPQPLGLCCLVRMVSRMTPSELGIIP